MAKLLFGYIFATCVKSEYFLFTNKHISERYQCSISQVAEWLSSLKKAGFINIETVGRNNLRCISSLIPTKDL
jgi:hypothetical protein